VGTVDAREFDIITCSWLDTGFGLVIRFIGLLQTVTTTNYSAVANSHSSQFTIAPAKLSTSSLDVNMQWLPTLATPLPPRPRLRQGATVSRQVKVTLRPTTSRSVRLGFEAHLSLMTGY
jgi:hypothetical protein